MVEFLSILVLFLAIIAVPVALWYETKKYKQHRSNIEAKLASAGFNISSRTVGRDVGMFDTAHYSLYVDDVNKKWVITLASPKHEFMDKIRSFDELVDYVFYDEDANNWATKVQNFTGKALETINKANQGGATILGVILGAGVGASIVAGSGGRRVGLGAVLGGLFGGLGASRLTQMQKRQPKQSLSGAYGLIVQTTDADESNPVSVYNFLDIDGKTIKPVNMVDRSRRAYRKDIKIIAKMADVLGEIQRSTSNQ